MTEYLNDRFLFHLPEAEAIWLLLYDYIASEDGPDYNEAEMEKLCADVLPRVWDRVLALERAHFADEVDVALARLEARLATLREVSALAWDLGATYYDDAPMHRFAMKLQSLVNEAEAGIRHESHEPRDPEDA